ncbi:MAG: hypothetical protein QGD90_09285, partial [Candidatus Hydrogenedentes bacterium]|nr:hypothetical protein [Candidatus Hydrogenedentota bacterium]
KTTMPPDIQLLTLTAASIGFLHTVLGPDHYLPFVMMSRARGWSLAKTACITTACGVAHILSSLVLGSIGIGLGFAAAQLETLEAIRDSVAAWALICLGFAYFLWGLRRAIKNRPHSHWHAHDETGPHTHGHGHMRHHAHVHAGEEAGSLTPWLLFVIFVFGPCEALIPVLMYPAFTRSFSGLLLVTGVYGGVTLITMLSIVLLTTWGANLLPLGKMERYTHAAAGAAICLCGVAIKVLEV